MKTPSMFQRRHYEAIVSLLADLNEPPSATLFEAFEDMFRRDNRLFDIQKFRDTYLRLRSLQ